MLRGVVRASAYGLAVLPVLAMAGGQAAGGNLDVLDVVVQLGVGGVVAVVALKIAQVLYESKETATREHAARMESVTKEHHRAVLDLTERHLAELHQTRETMTELCRAIQTHTADFQIMHSEIRGELARRELERT